MNKYKYSLVIILLSIIFQIKCNSPSNKGYFKEFPKQIKINAKKIKNKKVQTTRNFIGILDSSIIIGNHNDNKIIYLINKYDLSLERKIIRRGKGPGEIPWLRGIDLYKKKLFIKSGDKNKIYTFFLPKTLLKGDLIYKEYMDYTFTNEIFEMEIINDSLLIYSGSIEHLLTLINNKGETLNNIGNIPTKPKKVPKVHHDNLYTHFFTYNKKREKIVVGYYFFDRLIAYDIKGNKIFEKKGPDKIKSDYNDLYKPDQKKCYYQIKSDYNYIYCLYSGRKSYKKLSEATGINNIKDLYPKSILIFDWEGNPKLRVNLSHECRDFIIDKETNRLITLSLEEKPFHVYDFSKIKQALD